MPTEFDWTIGQEPPILHSHSEAKIRLLELYLDRYFTTLTVQPQLDKLSISLVDGFSGGGRFRFKEGYRSGTPFAMLNAVKIAEARLNENRRKPLKIDAQFYFVDKEKNSTDYLKAEIRNSEFRAEVDKSIHIFNDDFCDVYRKIVEHIAIRTPTGRSVFLLDQKGFKQVPSAVLRDIFSSLGRSELILTFAADWFLTYLHDHSSFLAASAAIEINSDQIRKYLEAKGQPGGRYLMQRLLLDDLKKSVGARFFTPFFLKSENSNRHLWVIHLSRIPTARNVMTASHWDISNSSLHHGVAGLNMLGFDPNWEDTLPLDFNFDANADEKIMSALLNEIPLSISQLDQGNPPTYDMFLSHVANDTAARKSHIEKALLHLHYENEIDILTPSARRKLTGSTINSTDRISLSRQPIFPSFKR